MYNSRIEEKHFRTNNLAAENKKLEEIESSLLGKLQQTYNKEKQMALDLNKINSKSPVRTKSSVEI